MFDLNPETTQKLNLIESILRDSQLIETLNQLLNNAGLEYVVKNVVLTDANIKCVCREWGIVGYERRCTTYPGQPEVCTETPIYGCKYMDCVHGLSGK